MKEPPKPPAFDPYLVPEAFMPRQSTPVASRVKFEEETKSQVNQHLKEATEEIKA